MDSTRRALLGGTALVAAGALASCGTIDVNNVITTIEQLIQKVQQGVATVCATVGKLVPTVDTVVAVIQGFLGAVLTNTNLSQALAFIQQAVDAIAAVGCPQPPSGAKATPGGTANVNGKPVPINFY